MPNSIVKRHKAAAPFAVNFGTMSDDTRCARFTVADGAARRPCQIAVARSALCLRNGEILFLVPGAMITRGEVGADDQNQGDSLGGQSLNGGEDGEP